MSADDSVILRAEDLDILGSSQMPLDANLAQRFKELERREQLLLSEKAADQRKIKTLLVESEIQNARLAKATMVMEEHLGSEKFHRQRRSDTRGLTISAFLLAALILFAGMWISRQNAELGRQAQLQADRYDRMLLAQQAQLDEARDRLRREQADFRASQAHVQAPQRQTSDPLWKSVAWSATKLAAAAMVPSIVGNFLGSDLAPSLFRKAAGAVTGNGRSLDGPRVQVNNLVTQPWPKLPAAFDNIGLQDYT